MLLVGEQSKMLGATARTLSILRVSNEMRPVLGVTILNHPMIVYGYSAECMDPVLDYQIDAPFRLSLLRQKQLRVDASMPKPACVAHIERIA